MALSDRQVDGLIIGGAVAAVLVAILAIAFGVLAVVSYHAPNPPDPTMTVCREAYGTCTEAGR